MATLKEIIDRKNRRMSEVPDEFLERVEAAQKKIFSDLLALIDRLDRDDDRLRSSSSNINKIGGIIQDLRDAIGTGGYPKAVNRFVKEFGIQKIVNDQYFEKAFDKDTANKFANALLKKAQADAREAFLGTPIDKEFLIPVESLLTDAVGTGGTWQDTVQNIRAFAEGSEQVDGKLLRYSKQIAHDRFAVSDRSYTNAISDELGNEWFLYSGSTIETSRCFCVERHQKYYHWKEIRAWGQGKDLGNCKYRDLWQGAFSNTTGENVFIYAGGANCRHSILPVSVFQVPKDAIERNLANGNYNPSTAEAGELALDGNFSQTERIGEYLEDAREAAPELDRRTKAIAQEQGARITPINLKSEESILRKARTEYGGDVSQVKDSVRTTIIADGESIADVISAVKEEFGKAIVSYKEQSPDKFMGYSGHLFNVRLENGTIGEVQVNTPRMIYAKESEASARRVLGDELWERIKKETGLDGGLGHDIYEEWRLETTSAARKEELKRMSEEYYSHFREKKRAPEPLDVDMSAIRGKGLWPDIEEEFFNKQFQFDGVHTNMTADEKKAVFGYTRDGGYELINKYLRTGEIEDKYLSYYSREYFEEYTKLMGNALDKINEPHVGDVWRGLRAYGNENISQIVKPYIDSFRDGTTLTERQFVSTTRNRDSMFHGNVTLKIKSKTGKLIKDLSDIEQEEEVLFKPGTKFRVVEMSEAVDDGHKFYFFELEEVS